MVTIDGTKFGRLITAMVTPYDREGDVFYGRAVRLARALIASGSSTVVVTGTTGESPTLTHGEKLHLYEVVVDGLKGGPAFVIAGTTNYDTRESMDLTRQAQAAGVDGILMVVPYYNNPPQEGLYRHFRAIAESTELPCILYNVPSRTVRNMEAATVARLMEVSNIVGIKEASGNMEQVAAIIQTAREKRPNFRVWSGNDQDTFNILCLGGYGVVSVASHIVGRSIRTMIDAFAVGNLTGARDLHLTLMPLAKALFPPVSPVASPSAVKCALNMMGFKVGGLRLPLIELPPDAAESLSNLLSNYELDDLPVTED